MRIAGTLRGWAVGIGLLAGMAVAAAPAMAGTITWTFQNEASIYGSTGDLITGSFNYDTVSGLVTNWNVTLPNTSTGSIAMPTVTLTPANSTSPSGFPDFGTPSFGTPNIGPEDNFYEAYTLSLLNPPMNLGTAATLSGFQWEEGYNPTVGTTYTQDYNGTMVGHLVTPEPATWTLLATGALLLLGLAWRRRSAPQAG